jgi:hypothetical protein
MTNSIEGDEVIAAFVEDAESEEATAVSFGHFRVAVTRLWERSFRPLQTAVEDQL